MISLALIGVRGRETPVNEAVERANYFLGLLGPDRQVFLERVKRGLAIPCPQPTVQQLEEAQNAERSEGVSVFPDGGPEGT